LSKYKYWRRGRNYESMPSSKSWGSSAAGHYEIQLKQQDDKCAICGKKFDRSKEYSWVCMDGTSIARDHNHDYTRNDPRAWRGVLCTTCNVNVGMLETALKDIEPILDYLSRWNSL